MVVIRACREQDLAGLLGLYAELRPRDPVLTPSVARAALRQLLPSPGCGSWWPRWRVSWPPPASSG